jgi:hypothetical protein
MLKPPRRTLVIFSLTTLLIATVAPSASASIAGKKCNQIGLTRTVSKVKYLCSKSGKATIWIKATKNADSSKFDDCPKVNPEADALKALAKREILNKAIPSFVSLEIEPGAVNVSQESQFIAAIAAATRVTDQTVPIKYFIPKTKNWFKERWPGEDVSYLNQVVTDSEVPFPAHSLGDKIRYAVAGVSSGDSRHHEFVQAVSIVLKPRGLSGSALNWYSHSFGGPYGAAISEALGIGCYSEFRSQALKMAKEMGPDLRKNTSWNVPQSGWYQGFLANEYLTGRIGLAEAGKLIPNPSNKDEIDQNFRKVLNMDLEGFYDFMEKRLAKDFAS